MTIEQAPDGTHFIRVRPPTQPPPLISNEEGVRFLFGNLASSLCRNMPMQSWRCGFEHGACRRGMA